MGILFSKFTKFTIRLFVYKFQLQSWRSLTATAFDFGIFYKGITEIFEKFAGWSPGDKSTGLLGLVAVTGEASDLDDMLSAWCMVVCDKVQENMYNEEDITETCSCLAGRLILSLEYYFYFHNKRHFR